MKYNIKLVFVVVGFLALQLSRVGATLNSDGFQLEIDIKNKPNHKDRFDSYIICRMTDLTSNQTSAIVYVPEPSYFYWAELIDTNGVAVPKTELGQTDGVHFSDLDPEVGLKKSKISFNRGFYWGGAGNGVHLVYNGNGINASKHSLIDGYMSLTIDYALLNRFNISSAGEYRLKVAVQFFELIGDDGIKLIRFPAYEGKIIVAPEDLIAKKTTAMSERILSSASTQSPAHAQEVPPLQVKSSQVLNTMHPTLAFAGYDSPDSALESWYWAIFQGDKTNMLESLVPEMQEGYKHAFDGKTDAQIKDGAAKMRSQFSGYTVQKMETISDAEVVLGFTMKGSDAVQKMIIKKVGNEWKVAGPSPDSEVKVISMPAHVIINGEKH